MNPIIEAYTSFTTFALWATPFSVLLCATVCAKLEWRGWKAAGVSWAIPLGLVALGYFGDLGFLAERTIFYAVLDVAAVALMGNGVFSWDGTRWMLSKTTTTSQPSVSEYATHKT